MGDYSTNINKVKKDKQFELAGNLISRYVLDNQGCRGLYVSVTAGCDTQFTPKVRQTPRGLHAPSGNILKSGISKMPFCAFCGKILKNIFVNLYIKHWPTEAHTFA